MHMIDEFTIYSAAALISTKTMAAKIFMKHWIAIFVAPKQYFQTMGENSLENHL